jgi:hypothetical protein
MDADSALRSEVEALLGSGLETEVEPRAYTSELVNQTVARLQQVAADDLEEKLRIAGFTLHAYVSDEVEQACETCMYYLLHRKFCELPELALPVEPTWSCKLWRI